MPFPADVNDALWTVTEVTDPEEAADAGYHGEPGHLKAVFGTMPTAAGYTLHHALLGARPRPSQPQVTSDSTVYTKTLLQKGTTVTPKLYWKQTSDGAMQLAGAQDPIEIQGLDDQFEIEPPIVVAAIDDVLYARGTGVQTVNAAAAFEGEFLAFSLLLAPSGVTIDTQTGVISIPTTSSFNREVMVRAGNTVGHADTSFQARVMLAPSVSSPIADQEYEQATGPQTVTVSSAFAGEELTFTKVSGPGTLTAGVFTVTTRLPLDADVVVSAQNAVGSASDTFRVTVHAEGGGATDANSIAELVSLMSSASPGEVIEMASGTYTTSWAKSNVSKAEPRVTLKAAAQANRPLIRMNGGMLFDWNNVSGFIIDGFRFEQTEKDDHNYPWGSIMALNKCSRLTFRNCYFNGARFQIRPQGGLNDYVLEYCEMENCGQGFWESFGGGNNVTLRNNYFHGDNPDPSRMHQAGRHPDGTQFGLQSASQIWNKITIEDNRYNFLKDGCNCHFFGYSVNKPDGFQNVTIRRNWYTSGDQNSVRIANTKNLDFSFNRLQDAPGRRVAKVRIEGNYDTTGSCVGNVIPRAFVSTTRDRTTKVNNVVSATATPQGWSTFDVANGRFGPYNQ